MSSDMYVAEVVRRVLHKRNYESRLQWNEVEICDLATGLAIELSADPSVDVIDRAIDNIVHARKNWQRIQLPVESAKWWEKLS